jgi:hypothetical protein
MNRIKTTWRYVFLTFAIITAIILACKKDQPRYCWKCHDNLGNITLDTCNKTRDDIRNMVSCNGVHPAPDSCIDKACTKQ